MSRYLVMKSACARPKYRVMKRACAGSNSREKAYAGPGSYRRRKTIYNGELTTGGPKCGIS